MNKARIMIKPPVRRSGQQAEAVRRHQPPEEIRALHWIPRHKLRDVMADDQYRRIEDARDTWEHGGGIPVLVRGVPVPVG
ncbi:hypothetical protein P3T27_002563 [Kitasatospora sp. MAA19]|uniref:hypothetical protein n=1 Tax=Kitasatospora sp. MAA19 TaxID=3035090 RepID=UPI0024757A3A|nr:hypothetical protein [Kitasatospora sp. MAA19]MDH6705841.1 hypothetical protein [Kitasatospora sp. MAA19]